MEDCTKATPLDPGPVYFFDQLKPKRKTWSKRTCKEQFSHLKDTSGATYRPKKKTKSKELKKVQLLSVAAPEKEDEFHSPNISQSFIVPRLPPKLKFSKVHLQKDPLEEYKLIAPEILYELEETLQKYAECNITFPVGIINLMSYTWKDLTEDAYRYVSKASTCGQDKALQGNSNFMTIVDLIGHKSSSYSREGCHKENHLVKAKKDHHVASSKSMEKISIVNQNQCPQIFQESSSPVVIHFSLSSKICFENGWIFQHPYSKLEILKWKTVLRTAVERLQVAIIQIKTEEAKLKKEGFNKQLILRHYDEPESKQGSGGDHSPLSFWQELLERKPQMPGVRRADPNMKKFHYALPSGRLAICQSYSDLPWGGMYTNIFSDLPNQVILGTFTPFGCGSISFPKRKRIAVMFNQDGGMVISKKGKIIREWMWPSKGKLDDPVEIWVNSFITVKIYGRFAITLLYKWHPQSLKLSLAPVKCKPYAPCLPEVPSSLADPVDTDTFDPAMDISPMHDVATAIKLRRLQRKVKHILFHWLNHYRFVLGMESLHICKVPMFPHKVVRKQEVSSAKLPLKQGAKEKDEEEYLRYRNTFLELKGVFKPLPLRCTQRTPASNRPFRVPFLMESKDTWFASQLICPAVLRRILCGKEGDICRCSPHSIPEVTDLEYDRLISRQLSSVDQIIIVCVFSAKKDKNINEVAKVYRELNRSRSMPCIQSHLDSFRLLKYNITSASKFTGNNCPLLVQRHNVIPGIFLMYIRGKLLFANFIFNGYSTSVEDLQKQIVKTRNDYQMGYFLPNDFRIRNYTK